MRPARSLPQAAAACQGVKPCTAVQTVLRAAMGAVLKKAILLDTFQIFEMPLTKDCFTPPSLVRQFLAPRSHESAFF